MSNVYTIKHPLIETKLVKLRDKTTGNKEFRELVSEISSLIFYEATKDLETTDIEVETILCKTIGKTLKRKLAIVPILRAGLGMVEGILRLTPNANVGHIGLYRDPQTLQPVEYYCKLPECPENTDILLLDPMLATGGTAVAAMKFIKDRGFKNIKFVCLLASPEGIEKVKACHPDVDIYAASVDEGLNDHGYILPGLGDAGDRIFGTK